MEVVVDVGIVIVDRGRLLTARRPPGAEVDGGKLVLPGGKPKYGEPVAKYAKRTALKETGLEVEVLDLHFLGPIFYATDRVKKDHHVCAAFVAAKVVGGALAQPDKNEPWQWHVLGAIVREPEATNNWVPVPALLRYRRELDL